MKKVTHGVVAYEDKSIYTGFVDKNNIPNGKGIFVFPNGDKCFGEHKDGVANGKATYIFTDGSVYVGEHKDGEASGQGTWQIYIRSRSK